MRLRAFLTATATAPIAGSGCLGILDSPEARFDYFDLINDDQPHAFYIATERGGNRILELARRVPSDDFEGIRVGHKNWANKPSRYTLAVAVADDRTDATFTERGCHDVIIDYRLGRVGVFSHTNGEQCSN